MKVCSPVFPTAGRPGPGQPNPARHNKPTTRAPQPPTPHRITLSWVSSCGGMSPQPTSCSDEKWAAVAKAAKAEAKAALTSICSWKFLTDGSVTRPLKLRQ